MQSLSLQQVSILRIRELSGRSTGGAQAWQVAERTAPLLAFPFDFQGLRQMVASQVNSSPVSIAKGKLL